MMVLRRGLTLTATGFAIGLVGATALTRLLSKFLYGVRPEDPLTLISVRCLVDLGVTAFHLRAGSTLDLH